jgi:hypothetical protein
MVGDALHPAAGWKAAVTAVIGFNRLELETGGNRGNGRGCFVRHGSKVRDE